jgi:protocatechuate 3,4-dioxygenase beta subunit
VRSQILRIRAESRRHADVTGEYIRSKVVDDQKGVPLHLDIQVVDVTTCKPMSNVFLELWSKFLTISTCPIRSQRRSESVATLTIPVIPNVDANSTGVYSGAMSPINGLNGATDTSNLNKSFLRGIQVTSVDGVAQFETTFPGHYDGRATHLHIMSHLNATAQANGTVWDLTATHAGQLFFDQDLISTVEKTAPYTLNRQRLTANRADSILLQEAATSDPFLEYVMLGNKVEDGVLAWYQIGIDPTFSRKIMAVALNYKEGGKIATDNPKVPGLSVIFPGGFPTAYQPGYGAPPTATGKLDMSKSKNVVEETESVE